MNAVRWGSTVSVLVSSTTSPVGFLDLAFKKRTLPILVPAVPTGIG